MLTRRTVLKGSAVAAGVAAGARLTGPAFSQALALGPGPFQYGVASGDPLPNGVIIWTRVTPDPSATPGTGLGSPTNVTWEVATSPSFSTVVASGSVTSNASSDHTVKVDVSGLAPATVYFYRFAALGSTSAVGRAKTAPAASATPDRVRFGLVTCSNYPAGFFTPYRYLAGRNDLDAVLHVGDYTYEYGLGTYPTSPVTGRNPDPTNETVTLEDYRRRQAIYKSDPDLQAAHAAVAWITTIDDHEVANDTWATGAENHQSSTEGDFTTRRDAAYQTYLEWMPIRPQAAGAGETRFYRRLRYGTLADFIMMDLRQYRDQQVITSDPSLISASNQTNQNTDATRQVLGATQKSWLDGLLDETNPPKWRLVGNSVQFMQIDWLANTFRPTGFVYDGSGSKTSRNGDAWDGYPAQRAALQAKIDSHRNDFDVVFLTGDIHSSWASELPSFAANIPFYGPYGAYKGPSVGVEFVSPSVTSDGILEAVMAGYGLPRANAIGLLNTQLVPAMYGLNPHLKLLDGVSHGCAVLEVTASQVQCEFWYVQSTATSDPRQDPNATLSRGNSMRSVFGTKSLEAYSPVIVDDGTSGPPPAVVPESPLPALLPLGAVAVVGGAVYLRQRADRVRAIEG
jgi:alkaline phosphatase D